MSDLDPPLTAALIEKLFNDTTTYWLKWVSQCTYEGRWREAVIRSALALKLLTFAPTGAIVAALTFSLPEDLDGAGRNWDYRYSWLRDSSFSVYALLRLGFTEEADRKFMIVKAWAPACQLLDKLTQLHLCRIH